MLIFIVTLPVIGKDYSLPTSLYTFVVCFLEDSYFDWGKKAMLICIFQMSKEVENFFY